MAFRTTGAGPDRQPRQRPRCAKPNAAALAACLALGGCKTTNHSASVKDAAAYNAANALGGFGITYFTSSNDATGYSCSGTAFALPPLTQIVAVTENSPLLDAAHRFTCQDNYTFWQEGMQPLWGSDHFLAKLTADQRAALFSRFPRSFRRDKNGWDINQPNCQSAMLKADACGYGFQLREINGGDGAWHPVQVWDACPAYHWNNAIKDDPVSPDYAFGGNPCGMGAAHVDMHAALRSTFGSETTTRVESQLADGTIYPGDAMNGNNAANGANAANGVANSAQTMAAGSTGTTPLPATSANASGAAPATSPVPANTPLSCAGNSYCANGWGWLNAGVGGCSSTSVGWQGNGCSCAC